jgi:hypothetical protein
MQTQEDHRIANGKEVLTEAMEPANSEAEPDI